MNQLFGKRVRILTWLVAAWLLLCIGGMVYLVAFQKDKYLGSKELYKYYTTEEFNRLSPEQQANCVVQDAIMPTRGVIYDDHERPLVADIRVYPLCIDGTQFDLKHAYFKPNEPYLDTLIMDLSRAFYRIFHDRYSSYSVADYQEKFTRVFKQHKRVQFFNEDQVVRSDRMIFEKDIDAIRNLPVLGGKIDKKLRARYGFTLEQSLRFPRMLDTGNRQLTVRIHPYGDLAGRVLGSVERKNGIDGCKAFNPILTGTPGYRRRLHINGISVPLDREEPSVEGGNLYSTLNIEMQQIVSDELMAKCKALNADWACAIVMETETGDIKAISNFTRDTSGKELRYVETRNYAMVPDAAEPGSTFKLATLLACLEQTHCDTTGKYSINSHGFIKGKYMKYDSHGGAEVTHVSMKEIFKRSSNVGVAMMARDAFPRYKDYVRKLDSLYITVGFDAQIGKMAPLLNLQPQTKIFEEQYSRYFGAAFNMQPIRTLVYYNAVANGGRMVQPRFVRYATVGKERIDFPVEVIKEQIASPQTIKIAQEFLRAVVEEPHGTARPTAMLYAPHLKFAGKTGTRDIYHKGGYDKDRNAVSFCGYFPSDKPKYTCIVYLYNVVGGSGLAVEVFAKIASRIMFEPHSLERDSAQLVIRHPMRADELSRVLDAWHLPYTKSGNGTYFKAKGRAQYELVSFPFSNEAKLPNLQGLTAADAVYELRRRGLKVRLSGYGNVINQSYYAETNTVLLTLSP